MNNTSMNDTYDTAVALELGSGKLRNYRYSDDSGTPFQGNPIVSTDYEDRGKGETSPTTGEQYSTSEMRNLISEVRAKGETEKKENDKVALLLTQGRAASMRQVTHDIDGIQVVTRSTIPLKLRNRVLHDLSVIEKNGDSLEEAEEIFAAFLAEVSLDIKCPSIWKKFNEETGMLLKVGAVVLRNTAQSSLDPRSIESFRKN